MSGFTAPFTLPAETDLPLSRQAHLPLAALQWHLHRSGEDITGHKVPYLTVPHGSDSYQWHLPRSGEDKNGHKVPYLAEPPVTDGYPGRTHGAVWNGDLHVDVDKRRLYVDAIMGRLTAGGVHRIELKGESLRRKNKNKLTLAVLHRNHF